MMNVRRRQFILGIGFLILVAGFFQNCSKIAFSDTSSGSQALLSVVCNPLDNSSTVSAANGMIGKVLYVPLAPTATPAPSNYAQLLSQATTSPATIYLSQFNVPTRPWTEGFSTQGQNALLDDQGNKLLEYFALQMQSNLQLTAADGPGFYQFAVISDDGGYVTTTDQNGNAQVLAGSTGGWHSTKAECGSQTFYMDQTTSLPLNLLYYQGPRTEIGMVFMWRKLSANAIPDQVECGVNDGGFFKEPSAGTNSEYENMLAAGWNVVPSQNFFLPSSAGSNPCAAAH